MMRAGIFRTSGKTPARGLPNRGTKRQPTTDQLRLRQTPTPRGSGKNEDQDLPLDGARRQAYAGN